MNTSTGAPYEAFRAVFPCPAVCAPYRLSIRFISRRLSATLTCHDSLPCPLGALIPHSSISFRAVESMGVVLYFRMLLRDMMLFTTVSCCDGVSAAFFSFCGMQPVMSATSKSAVTSFVLFIVLNGLGCKCSESAGTDKMRGMFSCLRTGWAERGGSEKAETIENCAFVCFCFRLSLYLRSRLCLHAVHVVFLCA